MNNGPLKKGLPKDVDQTGRILRSAHDLFDAGLIDHDDIASVDAVGDRYAIALTPHVAELALQDGNDAIKRQYVPDKRELDTHVAELPDPIGDEVHSPVRGVVHRYPDRVLLKVSSVCPVYCRFCFRREMVGPQLGDALSRADFEDAVDYIRQHPEIWEVILTGGDPLVLSDRRIAEITNTLGAIRHVKVLRWHTRVPVTEPGRITNELVDALTCADVTTFVALHANHAAEFSETARSAVSRLVDSGIPLVSQTVLLRAINDDVDALESLMRTFVELRIKPYYLHHGDLAPGTGHFRISLEKGRALITALRRRLSGLALPDYVLDIPGGAGKVPVDSHVRLRSDGKYEAIDRAGARHIYEDFCQPPLATTDR